MGIQSFDSIFLSSGVGGGLYFIFTHFAKIVIKCKQELMNFNLIVLIFGRNEEHIKVHKFNYQVCCENMNIQRVMSVYLFM